VGKSEGKGLIRRPRLRWENDVKVNSRETGLKFLDWT